MTTAFTLLRDCIVGNGHRANCHAPMTKPGSTGKYYTVHKPITDPQIAAHIAGRSTYAVRLIGSDGLVSAGLVELDKDHLDGARRVQQAAAARGVTMGSIATHGADGHDGSHNWALFAERVTPADARYLMQAIAADAGYPDAETWPNAENIRLPGGRHRWTDDWGIGLLPSGELFEMGNPAEHAAYFAAWYALPLNATPPEPPKPEPKPTRIINTGVNYGGPSPIEQFNAAHDITDLLASYGATKTRDGWACNCGYQHSHQTQLAVTSEGKIVSYSPNCRWAPHMHSGKAQDAFGLYCLVEHSGDTKRAVAALLPEKRSNSTQVERHAPDPVEVERRRTEAQRKRDARKQAAAELRAEVEARAAGDDTLTPCDHAVLDTLLTIAGDRGWARPSKERIAEMSGYSLGSVKRALADDGNLEGRYITSTGKGGGPNCTAIRTFLCGSSFDTQSIFVANNDPRVVISSRDHYDPPVTCEPAAGGVPDSLDTWEWQADAHGADELNALDSGISIVAAPEPAPSYDPQPASTVDWPLVDKIATWTDEQLRAWMAGLSSVSVCDLHTEQPAELEPDAPGASYVPPAAEPAGRTAANPYEYGSQPRDVYIRKYAWRDLWSRMERKPETDEPVVTGEIPQLNLPDPELLVRCPPSDPKAADRYWKLLGKARKKTTGADQRRELERQAAALEEWLPPGDAPRLTSPPAFRLARTSIGAHQAALFGGAT